MRRSKSDIRVANLADLQDDKVRVACILTDKLVMMNQSGNTSLRAEY